MKLYEFEAPIDGAESAPICNFARRIRVTSSGPVKWTLFENGAPVYVGFVERGSPDEIVLDFRSYVQRKLSVTVENRDYVSFSVYLTTFDQ